MSPFAEALRRLLDETNLFNRQEWVQLLFGGVVGNKEYLPKKIALIESWTRDEQIPGAMDLNMMWLTLEQASDVPRKPLEPFRALMKRRATEVSPLGNRMLPTVWEYMKSPASCELSSRLAKLSPKDQGKLLEELYPETPQE